MTKPKSKSMPVRLTVEFVPLPPEKEAAWVESVATFLTVVRRAKAKMMEEGRWPPSGKQEEEGVRSIPPE